MAEIQLNKPLYKESAPASGPPAARGPRPSPFARFGAFLVDVLVLHGVFLAFIKLAPSVAIRAGSAGMWIGLALGWLYFALGFSRVLGGRTAGKLVLRMRVADIAGPDLPFDRAALRAALLLWPAALYLALVRYGESRFDPSVLSITPMAHIVALGAIVGWLAGNMLHCTTEPFGRAWWDRMAGSAVVNSDSPGEAQAEFLRAARETFDAGRLVRARTYMLLAFASVTGLAGFMLYQAHRAIAAMPEKERAEQVAYASDLTLKGFMPPRQVAAPRDEQPTGDDRATSLAVYQYNSRTAIDVAALKQDATAMAMGERIAALMRRDAGRILDGRREQALAARAAGKPAPQFPAIPPKVRVRASYAEFADFFWAWNSFEVLKVTETSDLSDVLADAAAKDAAVLGTTAADSATTATAAHDAATSRSAAENPTTATIATTATAAAETTGTP